MPEALALKASRARERWRREAVAAFELWLVPFLLSLLPYRAGIALARAIARRWPLYAGAARESAERWREVTGRDDDAAWLADYRFARLVDHCDLFWSLTRSRAFLLRRLGAPAPAVAAGRPLLIVSFHYGQGLWLLAWLAAHGHAPRFLSLRFAREPGGCLLDHLYSRLRMATVERLANAAPIYTGGARREIASTLERGGAVYGLVDVPVPESRDVPGNATLLGEPVLLPAGLLESAATSDAAALVLTARATSDGSRIVEAQAFASARELTIPSLARALDERLARAPAAWHLWHVWPTFARTA